MEIKERKTIFKQCRMVMDTKVVKKVFGWRCNFMSGEYFGRER
jgi:hypothetical protein